MVSLCYYLEPANEIRYHHEIGFSMESLPIFKCAQNLCTAIQAFLGASTYTDASNISNQLELIIAELHHNLGCIGTETNQPAFTLEHFTIFNKCMIKESGDQVKGKDKRLAISWNELGNAYMMNEMWGKGEKWFKLSLQSSQLLEDFQPTEASFAYVNLGLAYWLMDRHDEAMEALLTGLGHRESAYGRDDRHSFM